MPLVPDIGDSNHRGTIAGVARVSGETADPNLKYLLTIQCTSDHALKCNYAIDTLDREGTLRTNYMVGSLFDSSHQFYSASRKGYANLILRDQDYPSDAVGLFKFAGPESNAFAHLNLDTGILQTLNLELDPLPKYIQSESIPEDSVKIDVYNPLVNIKRVEEYNDLRFDDDGKAIGGFTKILKKEGDPNTYVQTARCMPSERFGQWCTMSWGKINRGWYYMGKEMGRADGKEIFKKDGELYIPWKVYTRNGGRPTDKMGFTIINNNGSMRYRTYDDGYITEYNTEKQLEE